MLVTPCLWPSLLIKKMEVSIVYLMTGSLANFQARWASRQPGPLIWPTSMCFKLEIPVLPQALVFARFIWQSVSFLAGLWLCHIMLR